jgi:hypothetical protein
MLRLAKSRARRAGNISNMSKLREPALSTALGTTLRRAVATFLNIVGFRERERFLINVEARNPVS